MYILEFYKSALYIIHVVDLICLNVSRILAFLIIQYYCEAFHRIPTFISGVCAILILSINHFIEMLVNNTLLLIVL